MKPPKISNWLYNSRSGNYILYGDGFFLSYNPSTQYTFRRNRKGFQYLDEPDTEETALYITQTGSWLILNGDFRKEFEVCVTANQCKTVFKRYVSKYRSSFSTGIDSL